MRLNSLSYWLILFDIYIYIYLRKVKTTLNLIFTKIFREYHLTSSECKTNYETFYITVKY